METLFADTSFFVAYHNAKDENHKAAQSLIRSFESRLVLIVTTDYVFDEVMTVLLVRGNKALAVQAGQAISKDSNIKILRIDQELFDAAWQTFQRFMDKEWSFTDCTSYELMTRLSIGSGISFDKHFRQFGLSVLP